MATPSRQSIELPTLERQIKIWLQFAIQSLVASESLSMPTAYTSVLQLQQTIKLAFAAVSRLPFQKLNYYV